jgi:hypothetical protein
MASRTSDIPRLRDGDRAVDHRGNVGSVRRCTRRDTKEPFLGVFVIEGPDKGTWGRPDAFTPVLDWEDGTLRTTCIACDRTFLSRVHVLADLDGKEIPRDAYCRTCRGLQRPAAVAPHDAADGDYIGSEDWKTRHHSRESQRVQRAPDPTTEEQREAARRQREQDEKDLPF